MLRAVALSRHAAGKGRRGRAVCQDIAEEWDVSIDIASVRKRECEEAGTKGARGCKRDEGRPPERVCGGGCAPGGCRRGPRPAAGELADEPRSLSTPAASDLESEHGQAGAGRSAELRVRPLLGLASQAQRGASGAAARATGGTGSRQWRDQSGVNSQLNTPPERESVGDDLNATLILALSDNIEVTHTNIGCDCGPSFTTNTSCCTLERARTGTEDARAGARRNVVTQGIMSNPTAALRACEWEWQPQATENKHPEEGESSVNSGDVGRAVSTLAANGPACDSSKAMEDGSSSRRSARWQKSSTARAARRCHPRVRSS